MTRPSGAEPPDPADPGRRTTPADFFDDAYRRLLAPFHPEEDARRETAALREILALAQEDRILDLGCGWGRHLDPLAGAGHDIVGADLSVDLLRQVPGHAGGRPPLVAADMRALPFPDGVFDVVLNLATSLGLFLDDAPARAALSEARRILRPDGRLLLEGMHRDDVLADFAPRVRWFLEDGTEVRARRRFDHARGISREVLRWRGPGGEGEKRHALRIRSGSEVIALLHESGLRLRHAFGDWDGSPFDGTSPRLILLASPS